MNRTAGLLLALSVFLSACNPAATIDSLPEAKALAQEFLDNFEPGRFAAATSVLGKEFFQELPRDTWDRILPNVYEELGAIESCELQSWHQTTQMATGGQGTSSA